MISTTGAFAFYPPIRYMYQTRSDFDRKSDLIHYWLQIQLSQLGWANIMAVPCPGQPGFSLKVASGLVPDRWVERKSSSYRCHFRSFQLELDNLGTKNFEIGSVVKKLQPFEVDKKSNIFGIWQAHEQKQWASETTRFVWVSFCQS